MKKREDQIKKHFGILDYVSLGMFVMDKDFTVLFWNKCLGDWSGVKACDIVGKDLRTVYSHLGYAVYENSIKMLFSSGAPSVFSCQLDDQFIPCKLPNGNLRVQKTTVTPVPSCSEGELYALFSIEDLSGLSPQIDEFKKMRDKAINEAKQREIVEVEVKSQNRTLNSVLSSSPVGIALIENNRIKWANAALLDIFAFKNEEEYKGHSIEEFYSNHDEYVRVGREILAKAAGKRNVEIDAEFKKGDGFFTGHVMLSCIDQENFFKKMIITVFDLSLRIKAEKNKMQKEKLEGVLEMAGAVCHEMNQPIMAINCYSELLISTITEDNPAYEKIRIIYNQSKRVGEITRKLMTLTRYETKGYTHGEKIVNIDCASD